MSAENALDPGEAGGTEPQVAGDSSGPDPNVAARGRRTRSVVLPTRSRAPEGSLKGAGIVAVALGLVQVSAYLLSVAGARLLPPSEFGALASC